MTTTENRPPTPSPASNPALLLAISWLWVGIPLAWGIYATVMKSLALFR